MLQTHARRRLRPPVRHAHQRLRHRPVPAHRAGAVPQARASSAASRRSSRSTATSATRAPTPRTRPSSRCSRPTRRTATTTTMADAHPGAGAERGARRVRVARGDLGRRHRVRPRRASGTGCRMYESLSEALGSRGHAADARSRSCASSPTARASRCDLPRRTASSSRSCGSTSSKRHLMRADVRRATSRSTPRPLIRAHRSDPGRGREVGPVRPRLRAGHRLLRAGRPGRAARAASSSRRSSPRRATTRRCGWTRTSCGRWSTAMPPTRRHGHGHRPAADGAHRARHPRDDPVPAGEVRL